MIYNVDISSFLIFNAELFYDIRRKFDDSDLEFPKFPGEYIFFPPPLPWCNPSMKLEVDI